MTGVLIGGKNVGTETQGECHVKTELMLPQAKSDQKRGDR